MCGVFGAQIVKSTAIVFNYALAVCLRLERIQWRLSLVILALMGGVALASYGDVDFDEVGVLCALGAALLAAVRWVVTQRLLLATAGVEPAVSRDAGARRATAGGEDTGISMAVIPSPKQGDGVRVASGQAQLGPSAAPTSATRSPRNTRSSSEAGADGNAPGAVAVPNVPHRTADPLFVLFAIAPSATLALVPAFLWMEAGRVVDAPVWHHPSAATEVTLIIVGGGSLAFVLLFVEVRLAGLPSATHATSTAVSDTMKLPPLCPQVALVHRTSALSLNVIGNVKDVLKVVLAVMIFHDHLSVLNMVGVGLTFVSAAVYSHAKKAAAAAGASKQRAKSWDHMPARSWCGCLCRRARRCCCGPAVRPYAAVPSNDGAR